MKKAACLRRQSVRTADWRFVLTQSALSVTTSRDRPDAETATGQPCIPAVAV